MTSTYNADQQRRALTAGSLMLLGVLSGILLRNIPAYVAGATLTTFGVMTAARKGVRPDAAVGAYSNEVMEALTELFNPDSVDHNARRVVSAVAAQVPLLKQLQDSYTRLSEDPQFFNALVTLDPAAKRFQPLVIGGLPGEGKTRIIQKLVERFTLLNPEGQVMVFDPEYHFNQADANGSPWPEHLVLGTHIFDNLAGLNTIRTTLKNRLATTKQTTPLLIVLDEFNNLKSFPGMPEEDAYYTEFLRELKVAYNRAGKRNVMLVTGVQRIGAQETGMPLEYLSSFPWLIFPKLAKSKRLQTVLGLEETQKRTFLEVIAQVDEITAINNPTLHPAVYVTPERIDWKLIPHFTGHEITEVIEPGLDWLLKVWQACPHIIQAIEAGEIKTRTELADPALPYQEELAELLDESKLQRKTSDPRWQALAKHWDSLVNGDFTASIAAAEP